MELTSTSGMQRFLRGAVACLLTANGFALAALSGGDATSAPARRATEAAATRGRTVTLVTAKDGTRYLADRSTPEGRQAIENALRDGATVQDVTARGSTGVGTSVLTLPLGLDKLHLPTDLASLPSLPVDLGAVTGTVTGVADAVEQHLSDLADATQGAVTTLVGTIGDLTSGVTVPPVTVPPTTLPPVTVPPTTLPPVTVALSPVTLPPVPTTLALPGL